MNWINETGFCATGIESNTPIGTYKIKDAGDFFQVWLVENETDTQDEWLHIDFSDTVDKAKEAAREHYEVNRLKGKTPSWYQPINMT